MNEIAEGIQRLDDIGIVPPNALKGSIKAYVTLAKVTTAAQEIFEISDAVVGAARVVDQQLRAFYDQLDARCNQLQRIDFQRGDECFIQKAKIDRAWQLRSVAKTISVGDPHSVVTLATRELVMRWVLNTGSEAARDQLLPLR